MDRMQLKEVVQKKLDAGLSVQLQSVPGWGVSRWLQELQLPNRALKYFDAHDHDFQPPQKADIQKIPTTFIIDHFEELLERGDQNLFNQLRVVRDSSKYHVTYLIVIGRQLDLSAYANQLENFFELITETKFYFPACSLEETNEVIDIIAKRLELTLAETAQEAIYQYSGGIPALIKSWLLRGQEQVNASQRAQGTLNRIWSALTISQQQSLQSLLKNNVPVEDKALLQWKVVENNKILSQALQDFIGQQQPLKNIDTLHNNLTATEFRLYEHLKQHPDQICDRDHLIAAAWPEDNPEGVSDEALDQAMSRLRRKLSGHDYEVKTIKGRGYLLESDKRD